MRRYSHRNSAVLSLLFVVVGWPRRTKEYGPTYPTVCLRCGNDAYYHLVKRRRWLSLFFVPILPLWVAKYHLVCEICGEMTRVVGRREREAAKALARAGNAYDEGEITIEAYVADVLEFEREVGILDEIYGVDGAHTGADVAETMTDLDADGYQPVDSNE